MSSTDIAILAVIVSLTGLLITVIGWIVNRDSQKGLAKQQASDNTALQRELEITKQEFALELQKRQHISTARFADLQQINEWWKEGFRLANEFAGVINSGEELNKGRRLYGLFRKWRSNFYRYLGVAAQMDQMRFGGEYVYDNDDLGAWFSNRTLPTKLTSLISAMSELVGDFAMEAEAKGDNFDVSSLHDKLEKLYMGGTATIQKIEVDLFQITAGQTVGGVAPKQEGSQ